MALPRIDRESVKPGDRITVMVGGMPYDTVIAKDGRQRFVEDPSNALLQRLRLCGATFNPKGDIADLNEMAIRYQQGEFSQREYAEMNMAHGYSVDGFCELSSFSGMDIDNPLWDAPVEYDPDDVVSLRLLIPRAAAVVLAAVLEEGPDVLDEAAYGSQDARDEARRAIEAIKLTFAPDKDGPTTR